MTFSEGSKTVAMGPARVRGPPPSAVRSASCHVPGNWARACAVIPQKPRTNTPSKEIFLSILFSFARPGPQLAAETRPDELGDDAPATGHGGNVWDGRRG